MPTKKPRQVINIPTSLNTLIKKLASKQDLNAKEYITRLVLADLTLGMYVEHERAALLQEYKTTKENEGW